MLGCFGLSIRTRDIDLEDEFSRYGQVEKAVIVYDQRVSCGRAYYYRITRRTDSSLHSETQSERSRGFGFVTMREQEDAARCIEKLNGIVSLVFRCTYVSLVSGADWMCVRPHLAGAPRPKHPSRLLYDDQASPVYPWRVHGLQDRRPRRRPLVPPR